MFSSCNRFPQEDFFLMCETRQGKKKAISFTHEIKKTFVSPVYLYSVSLSVFHLISQMNNKKKIRAPNLFFLPGFTCVNKKKTLPKFLKWGTTIRAIGSLSFPSDFLNRFSWTQPLTLRLSPRNVRKTKPPICFNIFSKNNIQNNFTIQHSCTVKCTIM